MIRKITVIAAFIAISFAQEKLFTVEDVVFNSYRTLRPSTLSNLDWVGNTENISFISKDMKELMIQPFDSKESKTLLSLSDLNSVLKESGIKEFNIFPSVKWIDNNLFYFYSGNAVIFFDNKKNHIKSVLNFPENAANQTLSPDNSMLAFTIENNLSIVNGGKIINVTDEKNKDIKNGQSVHRNEFGIDSGIYWSPRNNYLAFYSMDESMVEDYPILELNNVPATVRYTKYPMAGRKSHNVKLGIFNIKSQSTIFLETGEPSDQYLTCVTWSPDEKYIFIAHLNREQNHMKLTKYDAVTGKPLQVLFEEKDNEFVEPDQPLIFIPGTNNFLWFSEKDGFKHLYMYDINGNFIKQVTSGNWVVNEFLSFDKKAKNIFITANKDIPTEKHLYKVSLKNGGIEKLTNTPGIHRTILNTEEDLFIDIYSSLSIPNKIEITNFDGKVKNTVLTSENPLKDYKMPDHKLFTLKTENNTDLYCEITYPINFDPTKKYPAIFYVYGGPHSQDALNNWPVGRYDIWQKMMAQKGYVVFYMDNRGTDNRGTEFEQIIHRQLGTKEMYDQLLGVRYLLDQGFVDSTRIGVWGWSYGGFMTTTLMTRCNSFKVGVAGGAVIDWSMYEIMYGERYMDTPQENPDGYRTNNLINHVANLKNKKLLLVHGTADDVVLWQHTLNFLKKASNVNSPVDYYPYINHGHGVGGIDALQLYVKITNYFIDNL